MFSECTGIKTANITLSNYTKSACNSMFSNCSGLLSVEIQAPVDPPSYNNNEYRCFYSAFANCSALQYVKIPWTKWDVLDVGNRQFTTGWMYGVHGENGGLQFWCPAELQSAGKRDSDNYIPSPGGSGSVTIYDIEGNEPLTFTAGPDGAEVGLQKVGAPPAVSLSWSKDGETWQEYNLTSTGNISLNAGESVQFKATTSNACIGDYYNRYHKFVVPTGEVSASGSLMSLLGPNIADQAVSAQGCFDRLFVTCAGLKDASQLEMPHRRVAASASGSTGGGCASIFYNCAALTAAPELPLMEGGGNSSWKELFAGCTGLSSVQPVISCYAGGPAMFKYMFSGCTSLTASPEFRCIGYDLAMSAMFYGTFYNCTSLLSGTDFSDFAEANGEAFRETYRGCTALTDAGKLSVSTFNDTLNFNNMYTGCTSLTGIQDLHLPALTIPYGAYAGMFENCTSLTSTPVIHAAEISANGMVSMFSGTAITDAAQVSGVAIGNTAFRGMY